jgi:hypothetical protein
MEERKKKLLNIQLSPADEIDLWPTNNYQAGEKENTIDMSVAQQSQPDKPQGVR